METALLKRAPARRFWVWILMLVAWAGAFQCTWLVSTMGTEIMADLGINNTLLSLIANATTIAHGFMCFGGAAIGKKLGGPKNTLMVAFALLIASGLLMLTHPTNIALLLVIRVIAGLGGGMINTYAIGLVGGWFPQKQRGIATSIWIGLYGPAMSLMTPIYGGFQSHALPWYQILGIYSILIGGICGVLCLFTYKDIYKVYGVHVIDDVMEKRQELEKKAAINQAVVTEKKAGNWKQCLTSRVFWYVSLVNFGSTIVTYCYTFNMAQLPAQTGYTAAESVFLNGNMFSFTVVLCLAGGILSDLLWKGKRSPTFIIGSGISFVCTVFLCVAMAAHASVGVVLVLGLLGFSGRCFFDGTLFASFPEYFEPHFYDKALGMTLMMTNFLGVAITIIGAAIADATGSYFGGMYLVAAFCAIGTICSIPLMKRKM